MAASPRALVKSAAGLLLGGLGREARGTVVLRRADLSRLSDLPDASFDAVVSVSALEHNAPDVLPRVVEELLRVLRPGGRLLATLSAARDRDWFHEPSQGWCYTEATLRRAFGIGPETPSNYEGFDELFAALRASRELKARLSWYYARSGRNGMPWRRWDPKYQPVGVCRLKAS
jgi:SAM-dependent methyltransferase